MKKILAVVVLIIASFSVSADAYGAVTYDASGSGSKSTGATTCTATLTVGSGSDRVALVGITYSDNYLSPRPTVTNVSLGGASFSKIGSTIVQGHLSQEAWVGVSPASGATILTVTFSAAVPSVCGAITFSGVDQSNPVSGTVTNKLVGGSISVSVPSASGNMTASFAGCDSCNYSSQNQTQRWKTSVASMGAGGGSTANGASSVTHTWTADWNGPELILIGTNINASAGGITPPPAGDITPPSVPAGLSASVVSSSQINLSWSASTDAVGVTGYKVYRGGVLITTVTGTSYSNTGLSASSQYTYEVSAFDAAGNESAKSTGVSATTQATTPPAGDTTAPTVSVSSPTNGATVSGSITLSASASDNVGVAGVQFKIDGTNFGNEDTSSPYSISFDTTGVSNGIHTVTATARDSAGNSTTASTITVTVSNTVVTPPPVQSTTAVSPVPPSKYVIGGRTFNPNDTLSTPAGNGTKYYVDGTNGNDNNSGTSLGSAFKTVQRGVNALSGGGDTLLIRGGLYREAVKIMSKDGVSGNPFVIGPYNGEEVILDSSPALSSVWTLTTGTTNIYQATTNFPVVAVVVDNEPLYREKSLAALKVAPTVSGVPTDSRFFYDKTAKILYVRLDGTSPATHDTFAVNENRGSDAHGIYLYDSSNYHIYGLTIRGSRDYGVWGLASSNLTFERNTVAFSNWTGLSTSDGTNNKFIKNYVYYNFLNNWPRGGNGWADAGGGWGTGMSSQGTTNAIFDGNISYKNGGEGILAYSLSNNNVFKNNVAVDNWSVNFYMDNMKNGVMDGNVSICHLPTDANTYNNGAASWAYDIRPQRPTGITTADEEYGLTPPANLINTTITNNIIINCQTGFSYNSEAAGGNAGSLNTLKYQNNTIIMPTVVHKEEPKILGIDIPYNDGRNTGSLFQNNIIVGGYYSATDDTGYLMHSTDPSPMTNFKGVTIDHNLFYQPNTSAKMFKWGGTPAWGVAMNYAEWLALPGGVHGAGDIVANPLLVNGTSDDPMDKKLQLSSPAIDQGVNTGLTTDYAKASRPKGNGYDMGAFESTGSAPVASDTTAPTVPAGLTATAISSTQINLAWTASTDAVGVTGYKVYRNGGTTAVGSPNTNTYSDTELTSGTAYTYTVSAIDAAGNESAKSTSVGATTQTVVVPPSDTTAPTIGTITTSNITTSGATITWTTNETSDTQVAYGQSTAYGQTSTLNATLSTTHSVTLTGLSQNTAYQYKVISRDAAGNTAESTNRTFTTLQAVVPDTTAPGTITTLKSSNITDTSVTLTWTAPGDNGSTGTASSYDLRYMGGTMNFTTATLATGEPTPKVSGTTETYTLVGLTPERTYTIALKATDAAGNTSALSNVVTVTTTATPVTPPATTTTGGGTTSGGTTGGTTSGGGGGGGGGSTTATPTITKFTATPLDKQVHLTWVNPTDKTFVRALVVRNEKRIPRTPTDGTKIYEGTDTSFTDTGLTNGKKYYYAIFTVTTKGTSAKASASLTVTPKAGVTQVSKVTTRTVSALTTTTPTIESLLALLAQLQAQLAALMENTTATTKYQYTRDLTLDSTGQDVLTLQRYLNNNGYPIALTGVGSKGNETGTFWYGTRDALKKYQASKGLPQTGVLDQATRAVLNR